MNANKPAPYAIDLETRFGFLNHIDLDAIANDVTDHWHNQTLCEVNDCVVRLGVMQGEFHWHYHKHEDEFFLCLQGEFIVEIQGGDTIRLAPHQGYCVPRGSVHRTLAPVRTAVLMIEGAGVQPTGDDEQQISTS